MIIKRNISIVFFLLVAWLGGMAQSTTLQVVTKKIDKTYTYKPGYELNIEGEKAEIIIETWNKAEIDIQLELVAKNEDQAIAKKDLEQIKHVFQRVQNKIYIRNYISGSDPDNPKSSTLSAKYIIRLPEECPVYLKNYFGEANVANLTNRFRFMGEKQN